MSLKKPDTSNLNTQENRIKSGWKLMREKRKFLSISLMAFGFISSGLALAIKTYSMWYVPFCLGVILFGVGLVVLVVLWQWLSESRLISNINSFSVDVA